MVDAEQTNRIERWLDCSVLDISLLQSGKLIIESGDSTLVSVGVVFCEPLSVCTSASFRKQSVCV